MVRVLKYNEAKFKVTQLIQKNQLQPGDKLASERELAAQLGMSIISVRRALAEFQEAGIVRKVSGVGTFYNGNLEVKEFRSRVALVNIGDHFYPDNFGIWAMEKELAPYQGEYKVFHVHTDVQPEVLAELRDFDKIMVTGFLNDSWVECLSSLGKPLLQVGESEYPNSLSKVKPDQADGVDKALFGCVAVPPERFGFLLPDPEITTYGRVLRNLILERFGDRVRETALVNVPHHTAITAISDYLQSQAGRIDALMVESICLLPLLLTPERQRLIPDIPLIVLHETLQVPSDAVQLNYLYQVVYEENILARSVKLLFSKPCDFFTGNQTEWVKTTIIGPEQQP